MYKIVKDWFFTKAIFVDADFEKHEALGLRSEPEEQTDEFRFNLKDLSSYNKSEKGLATVDVAGFRIVLAIPFQTFDSAFLKYLEDEEKHN